MTETIRLNSSSSVTVVGLSGIPGQGPYMIIQLKVADEIIQDARDSTYGCLAAQACGQWVCDSIEGKPLTFASEITEDSILNGVGQMPLGREHCPGLAIDALKDALEK